MAFSNVFERLGRAVFESPFESKRLAKDAPELAEIRLAAIDAIKEKSHRIGGKNVFPYDLVRILLLGVPEDQEPVFRSPFLLEYFADELKAALSQSSYRFSSGLRIEFVTSARLPLAQEHWISVETLMYEQTQAGVSPQTQTPAILSVVSGKANHARLKLEKARTNIGRTVEVFRAAGPSRRNDLAFLGGDEIDKTVSREHAHIVRALATSEYRLFNDRVYKGEGNCGLWVVRDGLSFPVHHGSRGALLRSGDEIHLGTAVVRFSRASDPAAAD
jgi:hypothetical protein